jgi:hypothetical protein
MTNNLQLSPDFTIERGRTARNIVTVTAPAAPGYNLIPAMAPFIAAILAATAPDRPLPRRRSSRCQPSHFRRNERPEAGGNRLATGASD